MPVLGRFRVFVGTGNQYVCTWGTQLRGLNSLSLGIEFYLHLFGINTVLRVRGASSKCTTNPSSISFLPFACQKTNSNSCHAKNARELHCRHSVRDATAAPPRALVSFVVKMYGGHWVAKHLRRWRGNIPERHKIHHTIKLLYCDQRRYYTPTYAKRNTGGARTLQRQRTLEVE